MIDLNQIKAEESQIVVLVGLTIYNHLFFKDHVDIYVVLLVVNFRH